MRFCFGSQFQLSISYRLWKSPDQRLCKNRRSGSLYCEVRLGVYLGDWSKLERTNRRIQTKCPKRCMQMRFCLIAFPRSLRKSAQPCMNFTKKTSYLPITLSCISTGSVNWIREKNWSPFEKLKFIPRIEVSDQHSVSGRRGT